MDTTNKEFETLLTKKNKLITLVSSVLNNKLYKNDLDSLKEELDISNTQIIQSFIDYNLDIFGFDNKIYNSISNRFILHIHNLIEGSWHQDRQNSVLKLIKQAQPKTIIDIGFGVPTKYIREFILPNKSIKTSLCDFSDTAIQFATALLTQWDIKWSEVVSFKQSDMCFAQEVCGNYDLYLFQDSIEHVPNPTSCLTEYVHLSQKNSHFLLSLPIGPIIPAHEIAWDNDQEAKNWLKKCGLSILKEEIVYTNPQVDLFAEPLGTNHHNLIVLCSKIKAD